MTTLQPKIEFATPLEVHTLADCFFYHVMDLPGVGVVGEHWDLRATLDRYLGNFDFRGKTALDVGTASGFLSFEMERRGAEVVSFDLADGAEWDIVPHRDPAFDLARLKRHKTEGAQRLRNAYWYAHRVLGSRARVCYGNVYELPEALGPFDAVVLGAILLHLRDPFRALLSASRLARDAMIISDLHFEAGEPVMRFVPNRETVESPDTWWLISEPCMTAMLDVLGFDVESIAREQHLTMHQGPRWFTFSTYVARRREK